MADYDSLSSKGADSELQDFLMAEKQKAQVNAQVCVPSVSHRLRTMNGNQFVLLL